MPQKPVHLAPPTLLAADGKKFVATDKVDKTLTLANRWIRAGVVGVGQVLLRGAAGGACGSGRRPCSTAHGGLATPSRCRRRHRSTSVSTRPSPKQLSSAPADMVDLDEKK